MVGPSARNVFKMRRVRHSISYTSRPRRWAGVDWRVVRPLRAAGSGCAVGAEFGGVAACRGATTGGSTTGGSVAGGSTMGAQAPARLPGSTSMVPYNNPNFGTEHSPTPRPRSGSPSRGAPAPGTEDRAISFRMRCGRKPLPAECTARCRRSSNDRRRRRSRFRTSRTAPSGIPALGAGPNGLPTSYIRCSKR
jgi:hypothetical protein